MLYCKSCFATETSCSASALFYSWLKTKPARKIFHIKKKIWVIVTHWTITIQTSCPLRWLLFIHSPNRRYLTRMREKRKKSRSISRISWLGEVFQILLNYWFFLKLFFYENRVVYEGCFAWLKIDFVCWKQGQLVVEEKGCKNFRNWSFLCLELPIIKKSKFRKVLQPRKIFSFFGFFVC